VVSAFPAAEGSIGRVLEADAHFIQNFRIAMNPIGGPEFLES